MRLLLGTILALLASGSVHAGPGTLGDDNPYPLACLNFSGLWRSDDLEIYQIEQFECRWLQVRRTLGSQDGATTIVPDDKDRSISGTQWTGVVRHRWNNKTNGTAVETHRTMNYPEKTVSELVILDKVNDDLLLESLYRTIERTPQEGESPGQPEREYSQRVLRRYEGRLR